MNLFRLIMVVLFFTVASPAHVFGQQGITTKGTITDASNGEPVPFASVAIKGTTSGISADENGNYTIKVPDNGILIFSAMGYITREIPVNNQLIINVDLNPDAVSLEDVVVVAYGVAKKESITGAISAVNSKNIEKRPVSNAVGALEGMTSGVQINNTNGEPGSTPNIRIRGFSTVNGDNSPLYVVDGVPLSGSTSDINPNDIENISILKDASSAALYGNRAANGVVLITTKRGKSDKFRVRASVQQGIYTRGIREYEKLDADDWMEVQWLGLRNGLQSNPAQASKYPTVEAANKQASKQIWDNINYNIYNKSNDALFDADGKLADGAAIKSNIASDLDWFDPIERVGYRQDYNLSGDGATDKLNYYFSVNYLNEKGYLTTSDMQRLTGRTNITVQPRKWIKLGLNLNGSHRKSNYTSQSSSTGYANPFYFARNIAPIYPVHAHDMSSVDGDYILDKDGNPVYDYGQYTTRAQNPGRNVVMEGLLDRDIYFKNTLTGQAFTEINFLKDFKLTLKGELYNSNSEEREYNNAMVGDGAGARGRAKRTIYRYKNYTFQQQLTYAHSWQQKHNLDLLLGHENYSNKYNYLYGFKTGESFPNKYDLVNFSEITSLTDYENVYRTEGYIARARYNYENRYFVEGSFRRDGSSRFHKDHRWGNFWSIGASWMVSREKWMESLKNQINDLKLRASYGEVGNDQSVEKYAYMELFALDVNGKLPAVYRSQNMAQDIVWESTNSFGIALEGRFFNTFNLSVEYFDKRSQDLLFKVYLPLSSGAVDLSSSTANVTRNLGNVSNRGWEINFDADIINRKNVQWTAGFNATFLNNKILKLPEANRKSGIVNGTKKYMEGKGIYDYWLYQYVGVDQMTGDALYLIDESKYYGSGTAEKGKSKIPAKYLTTINGQDYTTYTTYAKKDWSGTALPTVYGSFNTGVTWKNLSFSVLFTYSLGGKTYDSSYSSLMSITEKPKALHKNILNSWNGVPEGMTETSPDRIDPKGTPVIDTYRDTYTAASNTTRWLHNANYLVIKNVNLNYTLPSSICNKIDLNALSFVFSIENLATITGLRGMDPQQNFNGTVNNYFTTARTFSLGINITL